MKRTTQPLNITRTTRGGVVNSEEPSNSLGPDVQRRSPIRVEDRNAVVEKMVLLDLSRWVGSAIDDGLTPDQALTELRGRRVPWRLEVSNL
jgi:hypothetical protein